MPDLDRINAELLAPSPRQRPAGADHLPAKPESRLPRPPEGIDGRGRLIAAAAILRGTLRKADDWQVPRGAIAIERSRGDFANPWHGTGSALIFFDWLVGDLDLGPPAPPSVTQGGYRLVPAMIADGGHSLDPVLSYSLSQISGAADLPRKRERLLEALPTLAGVSLYCRCEPGQPCHADVLSLLANRPGRKPAQLRAALAVRWNFPVTLAWGNE